VLYETAGTDIDTRIEERAAADSGTESALEKDVAGTGQSNC
jgi:hypothetical protein